MVVSRRDFLVRLARLGLIVGGGGLLGPIAGCARDVGQVSVPTVEPVAAVESAPTTSPPPIGTPAVPAPTSSPVLVPEPAATPVQAGGIADVAVVQGADYAAVTRAAVGAVGGIDRFVPRGSKVVIKPNICIARAPNYAVTTHPEVVATLVLLCGEAGAARVTVLDYGFAGLNVGYKESGIESAVKQAGGTMERISMMKFKKTDAPRAKEMRSLAIYQDVLDADVIIDVPIAKHHNLAGLTLAMKNMMGVTNSREIFHANIGQRVADICSLVRPTLTVIDATRILLRNGPTGGNLNDVKKLDSVIVSADIVAADSYGATLFGKTGQDLATVRAGQEMGLGTSDLSKLNIARLTL